MATLYGSTGTTLTDGHSVALGDVEAKLRERRYDVRAITHTPGDGAPQLKPVHKWPQYVLIQVFDSEDKTALFPESGFYHLRELSVKNADFLLPKPSVSARCPRCKQLRVMDGYSRDDLRKLLKAAKPIQGWCQQCGETWPDVSKEERAGIAKGLDEGL